MNLQIDDGLSIPDFLLRTNSTSHQPWRRSRDQTIPYPPDGYLGKGLRKKARERLREARRRHAVKCRERKR